MLKIRLQRGGRRNHAHFRVVVGDSRNGPKSGRFIEVLGSYEPKSGEVTLNADRIKYWLSVGAQVSGTVHNFLIDNGIVGGKKQNVLPKKTPIISETPEEEKEAPVAESTEEVIEEVSEEAPVVEETATEEAPVEETPAEAPAEEAPTEETKEEKTEE